MCNLLSSNSCGVGGLSQRLLNGRILIIRTQNTVRCPSCSEMSKRNGFRGFGIAGIEIYDPGGLRIEKSRPQHVWLGCCMMRSWVVSSCLSYHGHLHCLLLSESGWEWGQAFKQLKHFAHDEGTDGNCNGDGNGDRNGDGDDGDGDDDVAGLRACFS